MFTYKEKSSLKTIPIDLIIKVKKNESRGNSKQLKWHVDQ